MDKSADKNVLLNDFNGWNEERENHRFENISNAVTITSSNKLSNPPPVPEVEEKKPEPADMLLKNTPNVPLEFREDENSLALEDESFAEQAVEVFDGSVDSLSFLANQLQNCIIEEHNVGETDAHETVCFSSSDDEAFVECHSFLSNKSGVTSKDDSDLVFSSSKTPEEAEVQASLQEVTEIKPEEPKVETEESQPFPAQEQAVEPPVSAVTEPKNVDLEVGQGVSETTVSSVVIGSEILSQAIAIDSCSFTVVEQESTEKEVLQVDENIQEISDPKVPSLVIESEVPQVQEEPLPISVPSVNTRSFTLSEQTIFDPRVPSLVIEDENLQEHKDPHVPKFQAPSDNFSFASVEAMDISDYVEQVPELIKCENAEGFEVKSTAVASSETFASDDVFKKPFAVASIKRKSDNFTGLVDFQQEQFQSSEGFKFSDTDFEYLDNLNSGREFVDRSSLLLKFDPLLKHPVATTRFEKLETTAEEHFETVNSIEDLGEEPCLLIADPEEISNSTNDSKPSPAQPVVEIKGSGDGSNETCINAMIENPIEEKAIHDFIMSDQETDTKMAELEKKTRNDTLKSEELEKKLEEELKKRIDVEQREEQLLKRITEKERAFSKLQNVVAEYEKAISEMITEKEVTVQQYETKMKELREDSATNAQHLASLESTFSDLHTKYERTKQIAAELRDREASLMAEKKALEENLRVQEQRYEKMKNHAVSQLEHANGQLEEQQKNHQMEITKLRAQLKKEEVSRASIQEQLSQKSKENEELVKICDELINGGGTS